MSKTVLVLWAERGERAQRRSRPEALPFRGLGQGTRSALKPEVPSGC